jgi:hypothetical protein
MNLTNTGLIPIAGPPPVDWCAIAKGHKTAWLRAYYTALSMGSTGTPDMPPIAIAAREDGTILATAMRPDRIDRDDALHAAQLLRIGIDPDVVVVIGDACVRNMSNEDHETHGEIPRDELHRQYQAGAGDVEECLMVNVARRGDQVIEFNLITYVRDRASGQIRWLNPWRMHEEKDDDGKPAEISGVIPNALKAIMEELPLIDRQESVLLKEVSNRMGHKRDRFLFHTARVTMQWLKEQGYLVDDRISSEHPEWIGD